MYSTNNTVIASFLVGLVYFFSHSFVTAPVRMLHGDGCDVDIPARTACIQSRLGMILFVVLVPFFCS